MMPTLGRVRVLIALLAGLGVGPMSHSATVVLNNLGGAEPGTNAYIGFRKAADFWEAMLTNNVTVNLNIGFSPLGPGILGSASSPAVAVFTQDVQTLLNAGKASALDAQAVANMPLLNAGGALSVITSGYQNPATLGGVNTATRVFDNDGSINNLGLAITRANAKALGYTGLTGADATIRFSSNFAFDFNPADGVAVNSYDFLGVAVHEIGHALGFISGVDTYDFLGAPNGPGRTDQRNFNNFVINSVLDLFRYSSDPTDVAPGTGPYLDWSVGGNPYLSVDRGATEFSLGGATGRFSTGQFNGDGRQASHWKDNTYAPDLLCSNPMTGPIGIMGPTFGRCEDGEITAMDLAAFDIMGWNLRIDVLERPNYFVTTANIYNGDLLGVPTPPTWLLYATAMGLLGVARPRRREAGRD